MYQYVLNLKTGQLYNVVDFADQAGLSYFGLIWFMDSNRDNYTWYSTPSYIETYRKHIEGVISEKRQKLGKLMQEGLKYKRDQFKRKIKI